MTATGHESADLKHPSSQQTPLTGELWEVCCEEIGENWLRYNGTALYYTYCTCHHSVQCTCKISWASILSLSNSFSRPSTAEFVSANVCPMSRHCVLRTAVSWRIRARRRRERRYSLYVVLSKWSRKRGSNSLAGSAMVDFLSFKYKPYCTSTSFHSRDPYLRHLTPRVTSKCSKKNYDVTIMTMGGFTIAGRSSN